MKNRGFTLIELMVVVLIVAVLAAILFPYMTARLEAARWSEGKAGAGALATAIRAMWAEKGAESFDFTTTPEPAYYLDESDLRGKYFSIDDYSMTISAPGALETEYPIYYTITVSAPTDGKYKWRITSYTLDYKGNWTEK